MNDLRSLVTLASALTLAALVAGCGDDKKKDDASGKASADPVATEAEQLMRKWDAACKVEGRDEQKKAGKAVVDEALKNAVFKEAYEAATPSKYGDNSCARGLRADTGVAISRKLDPSLKK
jgi:outer membrane murein-binding lipoprotein Lpp